MNSFGGLSRPIDDNSRNVRAPFNGGSVPSTDIHSRLDFEVT